MSYLFLKQHVVYLLPISANFGLFKQSVFFRRSLHVRPGLTKVSQRRRTIRDCLGENFYRPDALSITLTTVSKQRRKTVSKSVLAHATDLWSVQLCAGDAGGLDRGARAAVVHCGRAAGCCSVEQGSSADRLLSADEPARRLRLAADLRNDHLQRQERRRAEHHRHQLRAQVLCTTGERQLPTCWFIISSRSRLNFNNSNNNSSSNNNNNNNNKLCGKPRNMPPPLYAPCCSPAPNHKRLTPATPSVPCAMNIHDRQAAARSGRWRVLWCRPYKLCSNLNSQPKRHGDLDLLTLNVVSESRVTWATSVPILIFPGLSVLDFGSMYATDRQTDVRQHHRLMPRLLGAEA